jgi:hypothetical protein
MGAASESLVCLSSGARVLNCSAVVEVCAKHLEGLFRGKTVEQIVGAFGQCDDGARAGTRPQRDNDY